MQIIFFSAMAAVLAVHLVCVFLPFFLPDEPFYISIPYRLATGDRLFADEWHLSQTSSLFSFLPVKVWLTLTKSADGIILFLRLVFLAVHTAAAALIYRLFREYGCWAIVSAMIYYLQTPYKLYAISYNSMFALFLLLFSLSLFLFYKGGSEKHSVFAGMSFAACCVSNPAFAVTAVLYPIVFLIRKRRAKTAGVKTAVGDLKKKNKPLRDPPGEDGFDRFFNGRQVLFFLCGAAFVAVIALVFFFGTGGSAAAVRENLEDLLRSSEYSVLSVSFFDRLRNIAELFSGLCLHVPFLLPLPFIAMLFDRKRKMNGHRIVYLTAVIAISLICILGMRFNKDIVHSLFVSLPFFLFSTACYLLTETKNKPLFYCMFCPCAAAGLINLLFTNSLLTSASIAIAVADVSGVIFSRDLFLEMKPVRAKKRKPQAESGGQAPRTLRGLICAGCALQLVLYGYVMLYGQPFTADPVTVKEGPYAGMVMSGEGYADYRASLGDLDIIKARSGETDPILIVSHRSWMYLYTGRPIAGYTVWYDGGVNTDALTAYYRHNPDKIPKYVYLVYADEVEAWGVRVDNVQRCMRAIDELFNYEKEALSDGFLLTVTEYHPDGG